MERKSKRIWMLGTVEAILLVYYFFQQPECEPCLSEVDCPPCMSEQQVWAVAMGTLIGVISIWYFVLERLRQR